MTQLSHFDSSGQAHMVNVAEKTDTHRVAIASGVIQMAPETLARIRQGDAKKGDVIGIARIAAIQSVDFETIESPPSVRCTATVEVTGKTGVEMEALTAVSVGLLTIYDMCKAIDRAMTLTDIQLFEKHGGKSGSFVRS